MDFKAWRKKIEDVLMPIENEADEYAAEDQAVESKVTPFVRPADRQENLETQELRVANGGTVSVTRPAYRESVRKRENRPQLKVVEDPKLAVKVYVPQQFAEVTRVADDLKAKRAVIVNYEKVEIDMQRRICDFINGACYVMDGAAKRVSDYVVLYVPEGVETSVALSVALEK